MLLSKVFSQSVLICVICGEKLWSKLLVSKYSTGIIDLKDKTKIEYNSSKNLKNFMDLCYSKESYRFYITN
jgi:hypothetical protein